MDEQRDGGLDEGLDGRRGDGEAGGIRPEQRFLITIVATSLAMLLIGAGIGWAIGRFSAPASAEKPSVVASVVATLSISPSASVETTIPTSTAEPPPPPPKPPPPRDTKRPPTPKPLSPKSGSEVLPPQVTLVWSRVTDPSGISYVLEIQNATGPGKFRIGQVYDGIKTNSFAVEVLRGTRRWRVWAIDGAGNASPASEWSTFRNAPPKPSKPTTAAPVVPRP